MAALRDLEEGQEEAAQEKEAETEQPAEEEPLEEDYEIKTPGCLNFFLSEIILTMI